MTKLIPTLASGDAKNNASLDPAALDQHLPQDKLTNHVLRKAGYKEVLPGHAVRLSRSARFRMWVDGNAADDRYHRANYESMQRVTATCMAEQYRHALSGSKLPFDPRQSELVRKRFVRQDNLRFNPELADKDQKLSAWSRVGVRASRMAHWANGVTELGAAPTGMLLKMSRIFTMPKRDERSMGSQLRALAFLFPITSLVSIFSTYVFIKGTSNMVAGAADAVAQDIKNTVASFSAVAAVSALASLAFSGFSALACRNMQLKTPQVQKIGEHSERYLSRVLDLLKRAEESPGFRQMLNKALQKKISKKYCLDAPGQEPILVAELLKAIQGKSPQDAKQAIQETLGAYMTHRDLSELNQADRTPALLDLDANKSECLLRENHVVALTNLIEHYRLHEDPHPHFQDMRHWCESKVKKARDLAKPKYQALLPPKAGELSRVDKLKNPAWAREMSQAADCILKNAHQYGPVTVGLARASEALRAFNHGVILSLNYQLTRPIAWLAGQFTEHVLKEPNSRVVSFSVGRFVASSIWAVVDAVFLISLAGGNGVGFGGPEAKTALEFPLKVPYHLAGNGVSIISTAAQMIVVAVPAAMLMGLAKLAYRVEGWKGDVAVDLNDYRKKGREVVEI